MLSCVVSIGCECVCVREREREKKTERDTGGFVLLT